MTIHAKTALLGFDWVSNLRVEIARGQIQSLESQASARSGDTQVDVLLPALGNLHSHAFQRAMAGMTEVRAAGRESFWTWRTLDVPVLGQIDAGSRRGHCRFGLSGDARGRIFLGR